MADNRSVDRLPTGAIVDGNGVPTPAFSRWLDALVFGGGRNTIGKQVSGINEANTSIGALSEQIEAVNTNLSTVSGAASSSTTLTASVSPAGANGSGAGGASTTTNTVTVTPSGGVAPYTYAWAKASGDTVTINAPTAATTDFTGAPPVEGGSVSGSYDCTVTDSTGGTALTVVVRVPVNISTLGL